MRPTNGGGILVYNRQIVKDQEAVREEERIIRDGIEFDERKRREILDKAKMQRSTIHSTFCLPPSPNLSPILFDTSPDLSTFSRSSRSFFSPLTMLASLLSPKASAVAPVSWVAVDDSYRYLDPDYDEEILGMQKREAPDTLTVKPAKYIDTFVTPS
jgi:hypothetical protein